MATFKVVMLLLFALVAAVQSEEHENLQYKRFRYQLQLTQTRQTSTLNSFTPGSSFAFNDPIRSVDNTEPFDGNLTGFAFFIPESNPAPNEAVIEIVGTIVSNANPQDSIAIVGTSNSLSSVVTPVSVVGGTGLYSGATGEGRTRVTQFDPTGTISLNFAFCFFALVNSCPLPPV